MIRRSVVLAALMTVLVSSAFAHDFELGKLKIGHPWARATVAANGGAFLSVENTGTTPDKLLRASTDVAGTVELHTHIKEGDIMRMRQVQAIDIPVNQKVTLAPGGFHIMLMGLKKKLAEGERFPLTLEFEKAGKITVEIAIDKPGASGTEQHKH
jgi:copper(I)-binding protein